jgi:hypothetical protein
MSGHSIWATSGLRNRRARGVDERLRQGPVGLKVNSRQPVKVAPASCVGQPVKGSSAESSGMNNPIRARTPGTTRRSTFLHDVFADRPQLAEAVNKLLVTGFYMLNLGYALWILRASRGYDGFEAMQFLVNRLALLLVSLAAIHFVNVLVFWRIRTRRELRQMPSPVLPQAFVPPTPAPTEG